MDELVRPASTSSSPSSASFSTTGRHQELEFMPCDVLEGLLGDEDWMDEAPDGVTLGDEGSSSRSPENKNNLSGEPPAPEPKRRGRRPGPRSDAPVLSHVEAERQRRDRLHRRFCELRAAVPTVSRMDKASLLSDAAAYITQLRDRVKQLEAETQRAAMTSAAAAAPVMAATSSLGVQAEELEVRMVAGEAAALRLTTAARHRHAPARFMRALRSLDLPVQHACVCLVGGATVLDAVVDVPAGLRDEHGLREALLHMLQQIGW